MSKRNLLVMVSVSLFLLTGCVAVNEKACELNVGSACADLGWSYEKGDGVNQSTKKANEYYKKACDLDVGWACANFAWNYENGEVDGWSRENQRKARKLYTKACNLDNGMGCNNLGVMYENGRGGSRSTKKALEYYEKSCNLGNKLACNNAGIMYENGSGVKRSYSKAQDRYDEACGSLRAVGELMKLTLQSEDGIAEGCFNAGRLSEKGKGTRQSYYWARGYYAAGCSKDSDDACDRLSYIENNKLAEPEEQEILQKELVRQSQKRRSTGGNNALAQIVDAVGQYQSQQIQHTQNMTQMYRNATRDVQTNTIQPMNSNMGPEVYYGQRINDNMMSIQRVR